MKRLVGVLIAVALAVALPACANSESKSDATSRAAALVPKDALAYIDVSIDPSDAQKSNVDGILAKFPKATVKTFAAAKDDLLTRAVKDLGLDYQRDVKPWLGSELSFAVLASGGAEPDTVGFIKSKDDAQAKAALDKAAKSPDFDATYRLIKGYAVVVPKNKAALLDVIQRQSQGGTGLAGEQKFTRVVKELQGDRLLYAWADGHALVQLAKAAASREAGRTRINLSGLPDLGVGALDLHTVDNGAVVGGVVETPGGTGGGDFSITHGLPAGTLGALGVWNLGGAFDSVLGAVIQGSPEAARNLQQFERTAGLNLRQDVLSWMHGEAVIAVGPATTGTTPDFALLINPTDKAKAQAALNKIVSLAEQRLGVKFEQRPAPVGGGTMYVFPAPIRTGIQPAITLLPDKFILASSPDYLTNLAKSSGGFDDSKALKDTLGSPKPGTQFELVLQLSNIRTFVEGILNPNSRARYDQEVKPWVDHLSAAAMRVRKDGNLTRFEVKATVD